MKIGMKCPYAEYIATYKCPECGHIWECKVTELILICGKCGELGDWDKSKPIKQVIVNHYNGAVV